MSKQTYYYAVSGIFLILAVMHLLRVINGWEAELGGVELPLWTSWAGTAIAGYLAVRGFQFGKKM